MDNLIANQFTQTIAKDNGTGKKKERRQETELKIKVFFD